MQQLQAFWKTPANIWIYISTWKVMSYGKRCFWVAVPMVKYFRTVITVISHVIVLFCMSTEVKNTNITCKFAIVCQMLLFQTKMHFMSQTFEVSVQNLHHCIHHPLHHETSWIRSFFTPLFLKLAYLLMLFIFELAVCIS